MKEIEIIGVNELIDKSLDQALVERGIAYVCKGLGNVGAIEIARYSYKIDGHERVAYESSGMYDCDSTVSRSIVCSSSLNDESPTAVYRAISEAFTTRGTGESATARKGEFLHGI